MQQLQNVLSMIPPGAGLLAVGGLLAFGTKTKTVQWVALGLGGFQFFVSMQSSAA